MATDLYQTLGVSQTASQEEIKRAYKKMARRYHPDVNPGDREAEDRFKEISAAYEVLEDPEKRKLYDELGEDAAKIDFDPEKAEAYRRWKNQAEHTPGYRSETYGSPQGFGFDLGDMFQDIFGGGGGRGFEARRRRPTRGADITTEMTIPFVDAVLGRQAELRISKPATCTVCGGTGHTSGGGPTTCPACGGTGSTQVAQGPIRMQAPCPTCGGTGHVAGPVCTACGGSGERLESSHLEVTIPRGVSDGQKIRLVGQGAPGKNGGPPGDLYILIHVTPHPLFERKGDDLELELPVSIREAMLGAKIEIPTLSGRVTLTIPPGSQSGTRLRLKGKGVKPSKGGPAGDLFARLTVRLPDPKKDPAAAKDAAEKLEALYDTDVRSKLREVRS